MKILFVCTHNRCRSILSEAITNYLSDGSIRAYSAGSQPAGDVHPLTLKYLQERGVQCNQLHSQSWDDFESIEPDVVITVCDHAAREQCPVWFGKCILLHWGLPDPSKLEGTDDEIKKAFFDVMDTIEIRSKQLLDLRNKKLDKIQLKHLLLDFST